MSYHPNSHPASPYRPDRNQAPPFRLNNTDNPTNRPPRSTPLSHNRFQSDDTDDSVFEKDLGSVHSDPSTPILPHKPFQRPGVRFGPSDSNQGNSSIALNSLAANPNMRRKKSLVRPDRAPIDPSHRLYNYRNHAVAMQADERGRVGLSNTGTAAIDGSVARVPEQFDSRGHPIDLTINHNQVSNSLNPSENHSHRHHPGLMAALGRSAPHQGYSGLLNSRKPSEGLKRGQSILARGPGEAEESGLSILKRGETLRRRVRKTKISDSDVAALSSPPKKPFSPWNIYCTVVTCCFPSIVLSCLGVRDPARIRAWREKMGILLQMFFQAVCGKPPLRYHAGSIQSGMMIFHGQTYDFDKFQHVGAPGIAAGDNPVYSTFNAAAMDGSFMFQRVNQHCKDIITPAPGTGIPSDSSGNLGWYFPCNLFNQYGTSAVNKTGYPQGRLCHTQNPARQAFSKLKPLGQVYYTWDDLKNSTRNLAVYDSVVLDLNLLNWLDRSQVLYPSVFDDLKQMNNSYTGQDITMQLVRAGGKQLGSCLADTITVGHIDTNTLGCVASTVVLYASLVVIIGVVLIKWAMAVSFAWFFGWRLGAFGKETAQQRAQRAAEIENWTDDIYRPAPARYRPNAKPAKRSILPNKSRFTMVGKPAGGTSGARPMSTYVGEMNRKSVAFPSKAIGLGNGMKNSPPGSPSPGSMPHNLRVSHSVGSLPQFAGSPRSSLLIGAGGSALGGTGLGGSSEGSGITQPQGCPWPLYNVVPQPPPDYEPFNFPLVHTICLVTAYSESVEGLRTTLDSLATTDYPNSHKFILVIADGKVKGSGNDMTTPEICLTMMKELLVPSSQVESLSYVAIADGHKRHNKAKVFAGFYDYDSQTVEASKQQRVPMILIAKDGNSEEQDEAKPGNRGKRDSQVLLMSFLQKVMFDERMTEFDFEFFNSIWRITGVSPDHYEICLMVDADTKVFPDAVSRMAACMVRDSEIMGLCGETKIANKGDTWVTMIQVFEYYISHHLQKSFESMFGGVTCLPGCFSMYRIKAPKGGEGYWVPILANPDIVEHYSENVVETLHAKNLLLLGEDRFLTTLMLKTFPKRKMMFCPQAVCKTIVPDTFRVLLSQRRRWINSTIHNLFELLFVRDLCGTFCFSMQFVIGMELVGTLVLPAAISFTCYILVLTIIPGTEKPVVSLILLAFILGLPGLLITGYRSGSPLPPPSRRYSAISSMDNWSGATAAIDPFATRNNTVQELSLPQPLAREENLVGALSYGDAGISNSYVQNHGGTHQFNQQSYPLRKDDERASSREGLLTPTSNSAGQSPTTIGDLMDQGATSTMSNEFSHLFQGNGGINSQNDDDDQQSLSTATHSTGIGALAPSSIELKSAGFMGRGITLSDAGVVPNSSGEYKRVDRPKITGKLDSDLEEESSQSQSGSGLPRPPVFRS
ncbi:chitin synthase 3 [Phakopsora pachyrhizi]|uniref:chitin synthase n=1 Tax=Phakopsora pachyrhizi TaxID=170000 RepID=A0AAV0BIS2_PHAPC|nr:chitin synthase 3 [Phakopsora pachyrhizi]